MRLFFILISLFNVINVHAQEFKFDFVLSDYYGDYLGLQKPDTIPLKFAPGFISIDGESNMCITISSDGTQMAYTKTDIYSKICT